MTQGNKAQSGFSILELLVTMSLMLMLMGIVSMLLFRAMGVKARESQRTDALTSAQAALNVMSREIANAGFGLYTAGNNRLASNGLVTQDSGANRIHFRANIYNSGIAGDSSSTALATDEAGEDITYFFDSTTKSIVRYDPNDSPQTSVVVNKISSVTYTYFDYTGTNSTGVQVTTPTANTGRVRITVLVQMDPVAGQPNPLDVQFTSEVTLRNSSYMLNQY
jgi:prepilin-type N-terminal cleavage/methylation domain-containing protein